MSSETLYSLSAIAGIIAGICIFIGTVLNDLVQKPNGALFNFLGSLIGLFGITGFYLWQRAEAGTFGMIAYVVVFIGLALIACTDYSGAFVSPHLSEEQLATLGKGPVMKVIIISFSIFLVGEILFGISTLIAGVFPTAPTVLFILGFITTFVRPVYPKIVFVGLTLASAALIWWSISLWSVAGGI